MKKFIIIIGTFILFYFPVMMMAGDDFIVPMDELLQINSLVVAFMQKVPVSWVPKNNLPWEYAGEPTI